VALCCSQSRAPTPSPARPWSSSTRSPPGCHASGEGVHEPPGWFSTRFTPSVLAVMAGTRSVHNRDRVYHNVRSPRPKLTSASPPTRVNQVTFRSPRSSAVLRPPPREPADRGAAPPALRPAGRGGLQAAWLPGALHAPPGIRPSARRPARSRCPSAATWAFAELLMRINLRWDPALPAAVPVALAPCGRRPQGLVHLETASSRACEDPPACSRT
jgi:hypothetical protein